MTSDYACVFGKSRPVKQIHPGEQINVVGSASTIYIMHGNGCVFWFLFFKLPRSYVYPDSPRFPPAAAQEACQRFFHVRIRDAIYFRHLWEQHITYSLVPLEEGLHREWCWANMVCIGDSMHKVCLPLTRFPRQGTQSPFALAHRLSDGSPSWTRREPGH